jgi:predicted site-specific integrase-resolvase
MGRRLREFDGAGDLTVGEAARALGIHRSTLHNWPPDVIPYHRIGPRRDRRYRSQDVASYIYAGRAGHGRQHRAEVQLATVEINARLNMIAEADRTFIMIQRVLSAAGRDELARRLREARSTVFDLLDVRS